jgi:uncharacterized membrane protein YkvA (DUF1232 family)
MRATLTEPIFGLTLPRMLARLKRWAQALKRDIVALYLAARDPRVPWFPKALAVVIAAYALSPIDLIPDFIPVLGYVDELVLLPLAIASVIRLINPVIMAEHRAAADAIAERPKSIAAAITIIAIWVALAGMSGWLEYQHF